MTPAPQGKYFHSFVLAFLLAFSAFSHSGQVLSLFCLLFFTCLFCLFALRASTFTLLSSLFYLPLLDFCTKGKYFLSFVFSLLLGKTPKELFPQYFFP